MVTSLKFEKEVSRWANLVTLSVHKLSLKKVRVPVTQSSKALFENRKSLKSIEAIETIETTKHY